MVSDFQRRGWTGEEGVRIPAGTEVHPIQVLGKTGPNVAVADVTLSRDRFSGRERVAPSARLVRTGGDGPAEVGLPVCWLQAAGCCAAGSHQPCSVGTPGVGR